MSKINHKNAYPKGNVITVTTRDLPTLTLAQRFRANANDRLAQLVSKSVKRFETQKKAVLERPQKIETSIQHHKRQIDHIPSQINSNKQQMEVRRTSDIKYDKLWIHNREFYPNRKTPSSEVGVVTSYAQHYQKDQNLHAELNKHKLEYNRAVKKKLTLEKHTLSVERNLAKEEHVTSVVHKYNKEFFDKHGRLNENGQAVMRSGRKHAPIVQTVHKKYELRGLTQRQVIKHLAQQRLHPLVPTPIQKMLTSDIYLGHRTSFGNAGKIGKVALLVGAVGMVANQAYQEYQKAKLF
jgi:hypothetical protein